MDFSPIFCTVFDKNYLYQGVALYQSLEKHLPQFKLYCLALDETSAEILKKLKFKNLYIVTLSDLSQQWLNEIRPLTSYGQFCWSMQPLTCHYVLERGESHVTYIEADSYFFSSPITVFEEIGDYSACIAPHWYSEENVAQEKISGHYCTHFNFFRNNPAGRECLEDWRKLCFKYRKEQPLSYPGQQGLDEWPIKFKQVWELKNRGAGVAPWNIQQYTIIRGSDGVPIVQGHKVVFYHYHQLSRCVDGSFELGSYPLSPYMIDLFYRPYALAILAAEKKVATVDSQFNFRRVAEKIPKFFPSLLSGDLNLIKKATQPWRRRMKGTYNIFPIRYFESKNA